MNSDTSPAATGDQRLRGKVILVTGASRGIGRAIALRLAREGPGHIYAGYCMNREAALSTVAGIERLGVAATPLSSDIGQVESLQDMFAQVGTASGRLDIFVNCAARASFGPVATMSARSWQRTLDINLRAFLLGSQMAAKLMPGTGGQIVAISSHGAHSCVPGYAALGAAKAALESTARYLAVELAPAGINVNVVCPGLIETDSITQLPQYEEIKRAVIARTPAGRPGRPDDVAGVVAFLCSPEAAWIRGQVLIADGGYSLTG